MNLDRLSDKFSSEDVEWRIGRAGYTISGKPYGTVLAYITNRAIQNRLDEVCGPENWRNEFREWKVGDKHGVLCGISICVNGEWVTKWDGAENTDIESVKGGLSDAMKRAGVQWGIGRYLYDLTENFAQIAEKGEYFTQGRDKFSGKEYRFRWNAPQLPTWALPEATPAPVHAIRPSRRTVTAPKQNYIIEPAPAGKRP